MPRRAKKRKAFIRFGDWEFDFASAEEMDRLGEVSRLMFCWLREYGDRDVARALAIPRRTAGLAKSRGRPPYHAEDSERFRKMFWLITEAGSRGDVLSDHAAAAAVAEKDYTYSPAATAQRLHKNYPDFLIRDGERLCPLPTDYDIYFGLTPAAEAGAPG